MLNFSTLNKLLELQLKNRPILDELDSCTKYLCLLKSSKVWVGGKEVSSYQILKGLLGLSSIQFVGGPREPPLDALAQELIDLAVSTPDHQDFFGMFLPIRKWPNLVIFDPENFT